MLRFSREARRRKGWSQTEIGVDWVQFEIFEHYRIYEIKK
jgi:hypothetical protein